MATKPANGFRQIYEVRGGQLDFKFTMELGLTVEELTAFQEVISAVEKYTRAFPPESLEVKAQRLGESAIHEEFDA